MLPEINHALQHLLVERGGISAREVDVRFEAPTKEWIDSLTRPTVNLFLYAVKENTELRRVDLQSSRENGRARLSLPPRRIDLRYMISAVTSDLEDEHRLLWRTLATFMRYPYLPPESLPEELRDVDPPLSARIAEADEAFRPTDLWSALGATPRPTLCYEVTAPLDLDRVFDAPLVLTRTLRSGVVRPDAAPSLRHVIGGVVRARDGRPLPGVTMTLDGRALPGSVSDREGRFALGGVPSGAVVVRASAADGQGTTVTLHVPSDSYDITLT